MTEEFRENCQSIRARLGAASKKMERVEQGTARGQDQASIAGEIQGLEKDMGGLEAQFKGLVGRLDAGETRSFDEQLVHMRKQMTELSRRHRGYLSQSYTNFEAAPIAKEEATLENMQKMKEERDEALKNVGKDVKQLKVVNLKIKEKLDEGQEHMDELQGDIQNANTQVVKATNKTKAFTEYLRKNKAPFSLTILSLILCVVFWASKAFCSWGLSWQCPK